MGRERERGEGKEGEGKREENKIRELRTDTKGKLAKRQECQEEDTEKPACLRE